MTEITYKGHRYRLYDSNANHVPVEQQSHGWFIVSGYAGYNSKTNNYRGYVSEENALAAIRRYQSRRK